MAKPEFTIVGRLAISTNPGVPVGTEPVGGGDVEVDRAAWCVLLPLQLARTSAPAAAQARSRRIASMMARGCDGFASGGRPGTVSQVKALPKFVSKFAKPTEDVDREKLAAFCGGIGATPIADLHDRAHVRTGGEISALRIVPRSGAPALEVIVSDGTRNVTAVFLGRRKIPGVTAGRKLAVEGTVVRDGNRLLMLNPAYELF